MDGRPCTHNFSIQTYIKNESNQCMNQKLIELKRVNIALINTQFFHLGLGRLIDPLIIKIKSKEKSGPTQLHRQLRSFRNALK